MSLSATAKASAGDHSPAERFLDWHQLGSGASADVYKVSDRELGIPLAIKILKQVHQDDKRYVDSLRREVLISRKLRHPNICPIHDLYEGPHGVGIVMDLIEGQDLKAWMADHRGRLLETIEGRMTVLRKLAEALGVAHSQITHRDLKPANIFIKNGDIASPIIMDFGLSVLSQEGAHGFNGGTPKYMAPEQLVAPQDVDRRADIYALGMLAYELLTDGEIPVCSLKDSAKTGELPRFHPDQVLAPSTFCSALPNELDRLILQMLDHDADKRPQSAEEVKRVLDSVKMLDPFAPSRGRDAGRTATIFVPEGLYHVGERSGSTRSCDQPQRRVRLSAYRIGEAPVEPNSNNSSPFIAPRRLLVPSPLLDAATPKDGRGTDRGGRRQGRRSSRRHA